MIVVRPRSKRHAGRKVRLDRRLAKYRAGSAQGDGTVTRSHVERVVEPRVDESITFALVAVADVRRRLGSARRGAHR